MEAIRGEVGRCIRNPKLFQAQAPDAQCVQEFLEGKGLLVPVTTEASCRDRERLPRQFGRGKSTAAITRQLPETG